MAAAAANDGGSGDYSHSTTHITAIAAAAVLAALIFLLSELLKLLRLNLWTRTFTSFQIQISDSDAVSHITYF